MSENQHTDDISQDTEEVVDDSASQEQQDTSASDDAEQVTLSSKDYKELVSQRDRANEELRKKSDNNTSDDLLYDIAKERGIDAFLQDNADKYPDVQRDDLIYIDDPAQLEAAASRIQTRMKEAVQKKLTDVQIADSRPKLSNEDRAKQMKSLEASDSEDRFERMLDLQKS